MFIIEVKGISVPSALIEATLDVVKKAITSACVEADHVNLKASYHCDLRVEA
jgi:hypothetical protein